MNLTKLRDTAVSFLPFCQSPLHLYFSFLGPVPGDKGPQGKGHMHGYENRAPFPLHKSTYEHLHELSWRITRAVCTLCLRTLLHMVFFLVCCCGPEWVFMSASHSFFSLFLLSFLVDPAQPLTLTACRMQAECKQNAGRQQAAFMLAAFFFLLLLPIRTCHSRKL
jgi:hypothetical protein